MSQNRLLEIVIKKLLSKIKTSDGSFYNQWLDFVSWISEDDGKRMMTRDLNAIGFSFIDN
ncbi:hypothetical protein ZOSMA_5G03050 [Zostera marina]|uniref:Uncharacterized protein n=1 Tax=Zostera marina TaxID=29655 RepID=A0A0K9NWM0_ZOSMR|nr:hypothetical protein ZOSMA_5G03050 [Zostera marina]